MSKPYAAEPNRRDKPWFLYKMVAQNMFRTNDVKQVFSEQNVGFDDSLDVTKCFQQFEMPDLLHLCA